MECCTVKDATDAGTGASVLAKELFASLPLVQCSRQSPACRWSEFGSVVAQWLDAECDTMAWGNPPDRSNVRAQACAANAACNPKNPSSVTAATQRREDRRMAKLEHNPQPKCVRRGHGTWHGDPRLAPDQGFLRSSLMDVGLWP
jgi:hypothetical protein